MQSIVQSLQLTDFRSYRQARLQTGGRSVALHGPNGAGKTNLLEALSLFSPGRGLRGAPIAEIGRREVGESVGRAWAASAVVRAGEDERSLGSGTEAPGATRRIVRLDGESVAPGRMADLVRPLWLTPAQDRLFLEPASERRRFFDRLVFAARPAHAAQVVAYEKALRERNRLLFGDAPSDPAWLDALEATMATAGAKVAIARSQALLELNAEIASRGERAFPSADLSLTGRWETEASYGVDPDAMTAELRAALAASRTRDKAAGRALEGPHRGDLAAIHRALGRPAAECSTGEQKALILNLVLAQAARLSRAISSPNPILLLDEVAAHLDATRRAALFDEIEALELQAFLTGTDAALFESLKHRALIVRVDAGALNPD